MRRAVRMNVIDGRERSRAGELRFDCAIVGSGPAGATVAHRLARGGMRVAVLEAGPWVRHMPSDGISAMAALYRDMGMTFLRGRATIPYLQARVLGGTSVVNGAICWRLPREIHDGWPAPVREALPWEELEEAADRIEADLAVRPTELRGPKDDLMAAGASALGLAHRPIRRNVLGCRGSGRCLQGCPDGRKMSVDRTYLPDASAHGAVLFTSTTALRVRKGAIEARTAGGAMLRFRAPRIVLAASAVETPRILLRSGLPAGRGFQCHPGVSMAGRFPAPVRMWSGATQGHEVVGLRGDGIKFETLGYDRAMTAARLPGIGSEFDRELEELDRWAQWGASIRARAAGRVTERTVRFSCDREDMIRVRRAVRVLGEMMLAAGAEFVCPGVRGWPERVTDLSRFELEGPLDPAAYTMVVTHMFATCRMGADVDAGFRYRGVDGLYVADSSVFPSNLGVNPQIAIMTLASVCAGRILQECRRSTST